MRLSPKRWLRKLYPLHCVNQSWNTLLKRCQYFWLARHHGIDYYPEPELDTLYRDTCAIDLKRVQSEQPWIRTSLFPGGGAADHKLLYVLGRAPGEFHFRSILECGAGETTKMLDAFARHSGHV